MHPPTGSDTHGILVRVQLDIRPVCHIDPDMHMRRTTGVPDKGRPFQPPVVEDAIVPQVPFLVESQVAFIQAPLDLQAPGHLVLV